MAAPVAGAATPVLLLRPTYVQIPPPGSVAVASTTALATAATGAAASGVPPLVTEAALDALAMLVEAAEGSPRAPAPPTAAAAMNSA